MVEPDAPRRWVVVAEAPFLPARAGGELEHLGFVQAALAAGVLAALIVPTDSDGVDIGREDDLPALRALVAPAPVLLTPRARSVRSGLDPRTPYLIASRPVPGDLVGKVQRLVPDADAVLGFSYKTHKIARVLAEGLRVPVVIRQHNLEGEYYRALAAAAKPPRAWAMRLEALRVNRDERRLERASWLSAIADISASDAETRRRRAKTRVEHVPTFALASAAAEAPMAWRGSDSKAVIFLGSLETATNHDALRWFASRVWPEVLTAVPEATWQIVGRRPTAFVRELALNTPNAELSADVAEPLAYLRSAAVAVNPAVSGSGVNIKLVDYLAVGLPVVSTTRGVRGLNLTAGSDLAVADKPEVFAAQVVTLLSDSVKAWDLARTGHATALRILDRGGSLAQLSRLFVRPGQP
jgi:glycosyltransferase involved in cell wall biosynthesis